MKSAILQDQVLSTSNSFAMATAGPSHVQLFWQPLLNPTSSKPASPHIRKNGRSGRTTSPHNQPASLNDKADEILSRPDNLFKSAVALAQYQGRDSAIHQEDDAVGAQGRDHTNCDNEADGDLPSVDEPLAQISRRVISTAYQNSEDTLQHLEGPALDTSGRLDRKQPRLDDGGGDSQGTRDRPPTDPPGHGPWWDVEDGCFVDDDLRPIPPLEQEGLASTPAQGQPHFHHHPPGPSHGRINQHSDDRITRSALNVPVSYTLPQPLDENGGGNDENTTELGRDMQLAFGEQEKWFSATAPRSPGPQPQSAEPSHPPIDQEHDQGGTGYGRLEELGHCSPLRSQDQEEPQEQQQQDVVVDAMREGDYDYDGEWRHQDDAEEVNSGIHQSESSDHSHDTNDEDDGDPRPAKRQKRSLVHIVKAVTPPREHSQAPRLTPSSTMQPEMDEARSQAEHGHLPTPADDEHHHTPRTPRSPSAPAESALVAEYQEWPYQGFLKRTKIGNETTYNLEFQLLHMPEHLHLPVLSEALGMRSNKEMSAEAATPHDVGAHSKMHSAAVRPRIKRVRWTPEEDATILKMREVDGCSWEEIHAALPHRTPGAIQVQYSTKLKK
ncbi:uncharacterized protein PAC_15197 [Phialocephala subalpina]|uniref:Uncharacterized protein n=1 Tax=Phialocephala subalpina TaxID=576137 RepID=A0A1L7XK23_9HELO|nr:uncharacterized protein PAC_15197 [Phialocephala subalpina]